MYIRCLFASAPRPALTPSHSHRLDKRSEICASFLFGALWGCMTCCTVAVACPTCVPCPCPSFTLCRNVLVKCTRFLWLSRFFLIFACSVMARVCMPCASTPPFLRFPTLMLLVVAQAFACFICCGHATGCLVA